jgi:hypothetical protein
MADKEHDNIDNGLMPDTTNEESGDFDKDTESAWEGGRKLSEDPQGVFTATIVSAAVGRSKSSNREQIAYELKIEGGEYDGRVLRKFDGLTSEIQAKIAQDGLQALGIDTDGMSLSQLPSVLVELEGDRVEIEAKKNGRYHNIYFKRRVSESGGGSTEDPEAPW